MSAIYRWAIYNPDTGDVVTFRCREHAEEALDRRHNLGISGYRVAKFKLVECATEERDEDGE